MSKLKVTEITSSSELHTLYSDDVPAMKKNLDYDPINPENEYQKRKYTNVTDYDPKTKELVSRSACNEVLLLNINGKPVITTQWFITYGENELIYHIQDNKWVNLNMFDDNTSYCSEIYHIQGSRDNING